MVMLVVSPLLGIRSLFLGREEEERTEGVREGVSRQGPTLTCTSSTENVYFLLLSLFIVINCLLITLLDAVYGEGVITSCKDKRSKVC